MLYALVRRPTAQYYVKNPPVIHISCNPSITQVQFMLESIELAWRLHGDWVTCKCRKITRIQLLLGNSAAKVYLGRNLITYYCNLLTRINLKYTLFLQHRWNWPLGDLCTLDGIFWHARGFLDIVCLRFWNESRNQWELAYEYRSCSTP